MADSFTFRLVLEKVQNVNKCHKEALVLSVGFNIKHIDLCIYASISYQGTNINIGQGFQ